MWNQNNNSKISNTFHFGKLLLLYPCAKHPNVMWYAIYEGELYGKAAQPNHAMLLKVHLPAAQEVSSTARSFYGGGGG